MSDQTGTSEYLKIADAARFLGVTQRWVYRRIASGELPASKVGGLYFIRRIDLQNLLEQARVTPTEDPQLPEPMMVLQKCGYCFRIIESDGQIGKLCIGEDCTEIICNQCAQEGIRHCARHSPTREQRWEEAQALFLEKKIPLLVRANAARLMEINFVNRIQERMSRFSSLIHPTTNEVINLPNWDSILETGDERVEVMRLMGKVVLETSVTSSTPLNAWLRYRLPTSKGRKGPSLEIQVRILCRLPAMVRDGFDSQPYTIDDLLPWVQRLTEETAQGQVFKLLLLASITGWDNSARQVVLGTPNAGVLGMALIQRLGLIYLFDLPKGEILYNTMDERTRRYAELFSPALASEELAEVIQAIEKELVAHDGLALEMAAQILPYSQSQIRQAFEKLAKTGRYALIDVPENGVTLANRKYSPK